MRLIFIDESARDDDFSFFGALVADAASVQYIERGLEGVSRLLAAQVPGFDPSTEFTLSTCSTASTRGGAFRLHGE